MDKKAFFNNIRKEANTAKVKVIDKVEEVIKVSGLRLRINNLNSKIKENKTAIGDYIFNNRDKFNNISELQQNIENIISLEKEIVNKKELIAELHEKEENREDIPEQ
ncbi:MAG: hypothetical protein H8E57_03085 [Candidatus Cloacimonetes bacterium]|nr:hypothetical protein [Candidatus Cloacimonadota bacterium]